MKYKGWLKHKNILYFYNLSLSNTCHSVTLSLCQCAMKGPDCSPSSSLYVPSSSSRPPCLSPCCLWWKLSRYRQPDHLSWSSNTGQEYERAVIFRLGRLVRGGARGPGVFFIIPCLDVFEKIDMRTSTYDVPPQEILTKDSVTVFVNAIMYYKVKDATLAVANVDDYSGSAQLLAATTLRSVSSLVSSSSDLILSETSWEPETSVTFSPRERLSRRKCRWRSLEKFWI